MFKKYIKSAILGMSMLAIGAMVHAAEYDINMYGASAEYNYWTASDVGFLGFVGCAAGDIYKAYTADNKNGIAICNGAANIVGSAKGPGKGFDAAGDTLVLRYSSKASYDGIEAVQGLDLFGVSAPCAINQRTMADETNAPNWVAHTIGGTKCVTVNVAASDVQVQTFAQTSNGALNGPAGGAYTSRTVQYGNNPATDINIWTGVGGAANQYTNASPLVVPFSFWKNSMNADLASVTNLTRLMVTQIFSGQVTDWDQLYPTTSSQAGMASTPIVVCMRHAGSGTVATLDAAIMRGDYTLVQTQVLTTDFAYLAGISPVTYFNDGTSTEMSCVATQSNAVGYADSDQVVANTTRLTFQGVTGDHNHIVEGQYDYWSNEELYWPNNLGPVLTGLLNNMVTFVSNPANLPATEVGYWATNCQMSVAKSTDFTYPTNVGNTCPQ